LLNLQVQEEISDANLPKQCCFPYGQANSNYKLTITKLITHLLVNIMHIITDSPNFLPSYGFNCMVSHNDHVCNYYALYNVPFRYI